MATKPAAKPAAKKAAPKAAAKPAEAKKAAAPAAKPAKAVTKVFDTEVKVKKVKPTVTTETLMSQGHSKISRIFS